MGQNASDSAHRKLISDSNLQLGWISEHYGKVVQTTHGSGMGIRVPRRNEDEV